MAREKQRLNELAPEEATSGATCSERPQKARVVLFPPTGEPIMDRTSDWQEIAQRIMTSDEHRRQILERLQDGGLDSQIPCYPLIQPPIPKKTSKNSA